MYNPENYEFLKFDMKKLYLDQNSNWYMECSIRTDRDEFEQKFKALFRYDTSGLENQVDKLVEERETKIKKVNAALITGTTVEEVRKEFGDKIKEINQEIKDATKNNPDLLLDMKMKKMEYKPGNEVAMLLSLPDGQALVFIGATKGKLSKFKIAILESEKE